MDEQKLTPWFVNGEKPVRKGIYMTKLPWLKSNAEEGWSKWNGCKWANQRQTKEDAVNAGFSGALQDKPWRGLASDPKKGK